jgi:hypothetical protein
MHMFSLSQYDDDHDDDGVLLPEPLLEGRSLVARWGDFEFGFRKQ